MAKSKLINVVSRELANIAASNPPESLTVEHLIEASGLERQQVWAVLNAWEAKGWGRFIRGRAGHKSRWEPRIHGYMERVKTVRPIGKATRKNA